MQEHGPPSAGDCRQGNSAAASRRLGFRRYTEDGAVGHHTLPEEALARGISSIEKRFCQTNPPKNYANTWE